MSHGEVTTDTDCEDALAFLSPAAPPGDSPFLEVHQIWGNLIVDSRQYRPHGPPVRIGDGVSTRWTFLGVDMGRVPAALRPVIATFAPLWSDFETTQAFDFRVPDGVDDGWALFGPDTEGGFVGRVPPGWDAVVEVDGKVVAVPQTPGDDGAIEVPMSGVSRLVVERGEFRFVARRVPRSARVETRAVDVDPWFLGLGACAVAMFASAALLARLSGTTREVHEQDLDPVRIVTIEQVAPTPVVPGSAGPEGGAAAPPVERPTKSVGRSSNPGPSRPMGILEQLNAGLLGSAGLSSDLVAGAGRLIGYQGTTFGGDGLAGRSGRCDPGSVACGGSAEGHDGTGLRLDGPRGGPPGGTKEDRGPGILASEPIVIGAIDKARVDEVVKSHTAAVRYCYQRELQRAPGLGGKITVKFTIAKDGSVASASVKASTMASPAVESCVVSRFLRMQFPEPRGGGIVVVSYPFLFAPN